MFMFFSESYRYHAAAPSFCHLVDISRCSYHYFETDWLNAALFCVRDNKDLLCYKSKPEIGEIMDDFIKELPKGTDVKIWILNKNCSGTEQRTECLTLHIRKYWMTEFHYLQKSCEAQLPFICCEPDPVIATTEMTSTIPVTTTPEENHSTTQRTTTLATTSSTTLTKSTTEITSLPHCKATKNRGILWPDTIVGKTVTRPCPGNSIGNGVWTCGLSGRWIPERPDLSQCHSVPLLNIKEKFNTTSARDTIDAIDKLYQGKNELHGSDVIDSIYLMGLLPDNLFQELSSMPQARRWEFAKEAVAKTTSVFDKIMDLDSWTEIPEKEKPDIGSNMLSAVEDFGLLLADAMANVTVHNIIKKNIAIQALRKNHGLTIQLPEGPKIELYQHSIKGAITLSRGYDKQLDAKELISIVFVSYPDMSLILSNGESKGALNSPVVSATVSLGRNPALISGEVCIWVEHVTAEPNDTACVFWNLKLNKWDSSGCHLETSNSSHSLCVCDHLTNFAVLMDFQGALGGVEDEPLFYITIIGCSFSIVCLALCITVFTCYRCQRRNAWGLRYSIHQNLCITLLVANIVLVVGLNRTENQVACAVVAGLLHYFFLSAFSWMLLEGVHIYLLLVVVFQSRRSHWEKYYLFGYGFPLVVVAITAAARPSNYGTRDFCWLSVDNGAIWGFTGPVAGVLLVNSAALMLAQWKASKISIKDDNFALVKRWLRVTLILFPILGITWLFGFLYVGKLVKVAAYVFALLNSLQGVCIFICHCLLDKKARTMLITSIRKKRASVETESTGTQKKSKKTKKEQVEIKTNEDILPPVEVHPQKWVSTPNKLLQIPDNTNLKRKWAFWQKPWAFCFKLSVTKIQHENAVQGDKEELPKWAALQEKINVID